jgi:type IV secretory pathway TraG/TraD family ATPase VirD4
MDIYALISMAWAWLTLPASLDALPYFLAAPLAVLLGPIGLAPETFIGVVIVAMLNLYCWTTVVRIFYSVVGGWCGFYNPAHFRHFLWLDWRTLWKPVGWVLRWKEEVFAGGKRATGGWASLLFRLRLTFKPGDILLGTHRAWGFPLQQPAGLDGERHVTIIAGPGSGKTTHAISWVALHPAGEPVPPGSPVCQGGSAFIIDPKGLIASVTAKRKGNGGGGIVGQNKRVRIIDPFHLVPDTVSAKINIFDTLRAAERRSGRDAVVRYAVKAATGLVLRTSSEQNIFWPEISEELISGAILDVYEHEPREKQNLGRVYDLISHGLPEACRTPDENPIMAWLWRMKSSTAFGGAIAASANAVLICSKGETFGNIMVTIRTNLKWLKLPEIRRICESGSAADETDVDLEQLVTGELVLYLSAPATDIKGPLAPWFRLLTIMSLYIFEDMNRKFLIPCLFLLDEFTALGQIQAIQTAAGLMRSMGVRLVIICQDMGQLEIYPNSETFLGSAEACMFMGTNHQKTLKYIETALGMKTIEVKVKGGWGGKTDRMERREEPLMRAEMIKRVLGAGNIITIRPDNRPLITRRTRYFEFLPVCFYQKDRNHREAFLRSLTRKIFQLLLPGKMPLTPSKTARHNAGD